VTQPDYVPLAETDRVRPSDRLPAPLAWVPERPGDVGHAPLPTGALFGLAGPDIGYGMKLANRLRDQLVMADGESAEDAVVGCFACGARRAATFGRAPVIHDMRWAYTLWGFFGEAPEGLVAFRGPRFRGVAHDYAAQRVVAHAVAPATLRLTPEAVAQALSRWPDLFVH
jgi:hypothetical protein